MQVQEVAADMLHHKAESQATACCFQDSDTYLLWILSTNPDILNNIFKYNLS
jgi:hypothetical protein